MKCRKSLALFAILTVFAMALTACSEASNAMTEDEYQAAVTKLSEDFQSIQEDAANIDPNDMDAAKSLLEDCKAPLEEFIAIVPPELYKPAHEKLAAGSQSMIDFLDATINMMGETDEEKLQQASTEVLNLLQSAITDMTEGVSLMEEAAG